MPKPIHRQSFPLAIVRGVDQDLSIALEAVDGQQAIITEATLSIKDGSRVLVEDSATVVADGVASYSLDADTSSEWSLTDTLLLLWAVTVDGQVYKYRQTADVVLYDYTPTISVTDALELEPTLGANVNGASYEALANLFDQTSGEIQRKLRSKGRRPHLIVDSWALADIHMSLFLWRAFTLVANSLGDDRCRQAAEDYRREHESNWAATQFRYDETESNSTAQADVRAVVPQLVLSCGLRNAFYRTY